MANYLEKGRHNETFSISAMNYIEAENDLKIARMNSKLTKEDFDVIQVGQRFRYKLNSCRNNGDSKSLFGKNLYEIK